MRNTSSAAVLLMGIGSLPAFSQCSDWSSALDQLLGAAPSPALAQPLVDSRALGIGQIVRSSGGAEPLLRSGGAQMSAFKNALEQYSSPGSTPVAQVPGVGALQWQMNVQAETNRLAACFAGSGAGGRVEGLIAGFSAGMNAAPISLQAQLTQWQKQLTDRASEQQLMARRQQDMQNILQIQERMVALITVDYDYRSASALAIEEKQAELEALRQTPKLSNAGSQLFAAAGANRASNMTLTTNRATMSTSNRSLTALAEPQTQGPPQAPAPPQPAVQRDAPPLKGRPCKATVEYLGPALVTDRVRGSLQHLLLIQEPDNAAAERTVEVRFAWTAVEPGGKVAELKEDRVRASVLKDSDRGIAVIGFVLEDGSRVASGVAVKEITCVVK